MDKGATSFRLGNVQAGKQKLSRRTTSETTQHLSGDERAMPLGEFIEETLIKLETATTEVLVDRVLPLRANQGADEHGLIEQFNLSLLENPIPVA